MILPPDSDALKERHQSLAKMQNLNLPAKKQHNKPKVMDILQKQRTVLLKTNDYGKKVQGLVSVKGYMTTKIKLKGIKKNY